MSLLGDPTVKARVNCMLWAWTMRNSSQTATESALNKTAESDHY